MPSASRAPSALPLESRFKGRVSPNVEPDLSHFGGITLCGVSDPGLGMTSLFDLGQLIPMHEVDVALKRAFEKNFGAVEWAKPPLG